MIAICMSINYMLKHYDTVAEHIYSQYSVDCVECYCDPFSWHQPSEICVCHYPALLNFHRDAPRKTRC